VAISNCGLQNSRQAERCAVNRLSCRCAEMLTWLYIYCVLRC
jgi:hypothetical protein